MSTLLGLFFSVLFIGCAGKKPVEEIKFENRTNQGLHKHYIFLIHGIGGDKSHFGNMKPALLKALQSEDKKTEYIVQFFEYDTQNNQKSIEDFSLELSQSLQTTIGDKMPDEDKISLVMHSQGGLIGSIWLFRSLTDQQGYNFDYIDNVDSFATFGTPFWGAKTAIFAGAVKSVFAKVGVTLPVPFGDKQLEYMAFGSDWSHHMRKAIIQADNDAKLQKQKQHIRFLNVAASADVLRPIGAFVSGGKEYEDDSAVPLPSSRFNFIYVQNERPKQVDWAPHYLVNALHLSPLPEEKLMYGIVQTPKKCLTDRFCDHPTFHLIWSHILDREIPAEHLLASKKVNSFMIDINVNLIGDMNPKDIQFSFLNKDGGDLSTAGVKVADFQELYSAGYTRSKHNPQFCRFYFLGHFKDSFSDEQQTINVAISAKQIDAKQVSIPLKRGYSSFLEVQLEAKKQQDSSVD